VRFVLDPELTDELREQIITLWLDVSNAGGAVGFVAPTTREQVVPMAQKEFSAIADGHDRLLIGYDEDTDSGGTAGERFVAMLIFVSRRFELSEHWRTIKRVMIDPAAQGRGLGAELMREGERVARDLGWQGLHVTVRGGLGLERFYTSLGYKEVGRLPGALRLAPGDDRDEVLMWLDLS
jgi:GNAT superfamily N-acetyltransferase